jgi:arylsulfatase A-like enzyme
MRRLLAFLIFACAGFAQAAAPPNILLIVSDDFGADASSLYKLAGKAGAAATPNLKALAARGLVFDNAWVNPMCSPTRATILTGLYGHHTGVLVAGDVLDPATTTIFDYIKQSSPAKYDMAVFGKWHLGGNGGDIKHVMDMRVPNFRGFLGAQISDYYKWKAWDGNTGKSEDVTTYSTTALTNWAIDFIRKHESRRKQDPWFVYVPYNAVHAPFQVPPKKLHKTDVGGLKPGERKAGVPVYQAIIQAMDTEIGRLLKAVDLDRTLVIFVGDNGTPGDVKDTDTGVRGAKMSTYEGGAHVPLVMAGAGVTRKGREPALVNGVDLYATIASAAGIPVTQVNDAYSLTPLLTSADASTGRRFNFTEFCRQGNTPVARFAIRDSQYKLHFDTASGWSLFDLKSDPLEATNLHDKPDVAEVQKMLRTELDRMKARATKGCFQ